MTTRNEISCFVQGSSKRKIMYKITFIPRRFFCLAETEKDKTRFSKVPASNAAWISNQIYRTNTSGAGNSSFLSHFCIQGFWNVLSTFSFSVPQRAGEEEKNMNSENVSMVLYTVSQPLLFIHDFKVSYLWFYFSKIIFLTLPTLLFSSLCMLLCYPIISSGYQLPLIFAVILIYLFAWHGSANITMALPALGRKCASNTDAMPEQLSGGWFWNLKS